MNTKLNLHRYIVIIVLLFIATASWGEVKLPVILSDGMVMQREKPLKIWGTAEANETVVLSFSKNAAPTSSKGGKLKNKLSTVTNADGTWEIILPALQAGGPSVMQINDITLNDIYIGDVFLCSGQSNMELPVRRVAEAYEEEIKSYSNPLVRQIIIPKEFDFNAPQQDIKPAMWKELNQEKVMSFSAVAYFFAKELINTTNVPVGLINASWGGTPEEARMSEEAIQPFPLYLNDKRRYEDENYRKQIKAVEGQNFAHWNAALYAGDAGLQESTPWFATDYNDNDWEEVDILNPDWGTNGYNAINGSHWFRKDINIPDNWNGKEATLRLGCIVDADSVYVNGVFVGTTGYRYPPRIYKVPANLLKPGKNNITVRLISNGGRPEFVPEKPYKVISGYEEVNPEGNW